MRPARRSLFSAAIGEFSSEEGQSEWDGATDMDASFHYMWQFLGIPWQDIAILPKSKM